MEILTNKIAEIVRESIAVKTELLQSPALLSEIEAAASDCIRCFQSGGKLLFCGNGGSAADAQHIAAELSGRFLKNRPPLFAEALHVNSSYLTAVANDYGYDHAYARLTEAMGREGDVLVAISTSGNSPNILNAVHAAQNRKMVVVGLTGRTGGKMAGLCDRLLAVPSEKTARIQESHIMIGHILCEIIESTLFPAI